MGLSNEDMIIQRALDAHIATHLLGHKLGLSEADRMLLGKVFLGLALDWSFTDDEQERILMKRIERKLESDETRTRAKDPWPDGQQRLRAVLREWGGPKGIQEPDRLVGSY